MIWYKRMQEEDIKFLAELLNDTKIISVVHNEVKNFADWLETYHNFWKNDRDESHFIAFYDDEPAGWLKINGLESNDTAWIAMLVISSSYQKKVSAQMQLHFQKILLRIKASVKLEYIQRKIILSHESCMKNVSIVSQDLANVPRVMARIEWVILF